MTPIDWATLPIKKYADFSGRAPRAEFWWFYLLMLVAYIIGSIIDSMVGSMVFGPYGIVTCLVFVGLLVPYLAAAVRRLHDTDRTGWWIALPMVPSVAGLAMMGSKLTDPAAMSDPSAMAGMGVPFLLILLGGILGLVVLIFLILAGTHGVNSHGEDPYAGA